MPVTGGATNAVCRFECDCDLLPDQSQSDCRCEFVGYSIPHRAMSRSNSGDLSAASPIWSTNHTVSCEPNSTLRLSACNCHCEEKCQSSQLSRPPESITRARFAARRNGLRHIAHRLLPSLVLLTLCTLPCALSTPNHDAWRQHSSGQSPAGLQSMSHLKKSKSQNHHNFALATPASHRSSYASSASPSSSTLPNFTALTKRRQQSSTDLATYQYLNSQLLSIPFSSHHQMLYQHQMLPHHATFPGTATVPVASHQLVTPGNKIGLESNHLPTLASNAIRPKGTKWRDITRPPAQSFSLDQMTHMDGRHANAILPAPTSNRANINLPLRKKQRRIVKENPGLDIAIVKAMHMAINECENQLKDHRWNCPVSNWKKGKNVFGKIIQSGCRETAFVYALTSAAVSHSIARACSEGMIETCTCDYTPNQRLKSGADWEWGGCSDNIKFGYKYARSFVDAAERGRDQRFVMNLHNNEAGRLHVSNQMLRECKCHGMSGSCTVKTCWMRLASFREIGNTLKERFDKASRVRLSNDFRGATRNKYKYKKSVQLETYEKGYPTPTSTDLIFFDESPDFCLSNPKYGWPGTQGRECNASSISVDSCNLVCCDRGYVTEEVEVTERCNCTFRWCCEVNCSVCKVKKKIHKCK